MFDASSVNVAVSGAITKVGKDLEITSADQELTGADVINYGWVGSEGVTISTDATTNNIVAWQNSAVVRVASTEASSTYTFTLLQNTKEARELYYGAEEVAGKIIYRPSQMTRGRFIIDYIDTATENGDIHFGRHVINKGQVTGRGDIVWQNGEAVGYEVTITAFPDENGAVAEIFEGVASADAPATAAAAKSTASTATTTK